MKITVDNKELKVKKGMTVLDAAEQNGIYIPHLCSHPELTAYGGCRLCVVEIDGIRGYPTSCTTYVQDGMVIRTKTKELQEIREGVFQLMLTEHPSGCLVCEEMEACSEYQKTIRKVGVTTGCRWCTGDGDCEFQKTMEHLEIKDITLPVDYRCLDEEKDDPFFDRDYNLCIYCARCVRICDEHRKSSVITLNQRGQFVTIAPAYNMSHLDAYCEFCGACISVCPTGTLSEKNKKWSGVPDAYSNSICPLCSINCDIQTLIKDEHLIGTLPPGDPHLVGGELCVKGRFCLSELVNHPDRLRIPKFRFPEDIGDITWEEAFKKAHDKIKETESNRIAFYLSPDLTLEEMEAAKLFASSVIKTRNITSSALHRNLSALLPLAKRSVKIEDIRNSDAIISIFLNGNYNYGPVTLAIKRTADEGAEYYQVGWTSDTSTRFSTDQITPPKCGEKEFFKKFAQNLEKGTEGTGDIGVLIKTLREASKPVIVLGSEILDLTEGPDILESIEKIINKVNCGIYVTLPFGNIGGLLSLKEIKLHEEVNFLINEGKIDILYLVGDAPFRRRPPVDFIIQQSSFPITNGNFADLFLPPRIWGEISGTYINLNGEKKAAKTFAKPPEKVLEHREIFGGIAKKAGIKEISFNAKDIKKQLPDKPVINLPDISKMREIKSRQ
jgi:NADH dehydrogenase/NADH:ubiquinone oxidoreductase subunit G